MQCGMVLLCSLKNVEIAPTVDELF